MRIMMKGLIEKTKFVFDMPEPWSSSQGNKELLKGL
jgi:hypothetical protein